MGSGSGGSPLGVRGSGIQKPTGEMGVSLLQSERAHSAGLELRLRVLPGELWPAVPTPVGPTLSLPQAWVISVSSSLDLFR